jgi:hypothetical protein
MGPAQDQLVAAAPDFISTIQAQFDDFDVHIMVVDSEKDWWVEECEFMTCPNCEVDPNYPCGYIPTACDTTLGAGTIFNAGPNTMDVPCDLGEHRYITKDTPDIPGPSSASPASAPGVTTNGRRARRRRQPQLNASDPAPGAATPGFLRDDALLVLTMIGPEDNPGGGGFQGGPGRSGARRSWTPSTAISTRSSRSASSAGEDCEPDPIQIYGSATSSRRSPAASSST